MLLICFASNLLFSYTVNYDKIVLRHWSIQKEHKLIDLYFYLIVVLCGQGSITAFPKVSMSKFHFLKISLLFLFILTYFR